MSKNSLWTVVYASVIGNLHVREGMPCQDACAIKDLAEGWGIAVVADGAGSCQHSDKGAQQTVYLAIQHFANTVYKNQWIEKNNLPAQSQWDRLALENLMRIRDDLQTFSKQNQLPFESLSCTIIVLIYSPVGLLITHIGDGRAGYLNAQEEWQSMITPFRGEEANQTLFITSDFEKEVESRVINEKISAFCVLSDGCEKSAFECNLFDKEKNLYYDPNRPYPKFFNPNILALSKLDNMNQEQKNLLWQQFLIEGNAQLKNETDDKTLILGMIAKV
ncbi:MAG: protein phosphatase 2C domain-containing protein [Cytophagales bacterium]|nr:MAG: protein phosphatase 2C domain-containing protein [Cytophagales bacterium]